jgi:hypothetical protein
MKWLLKVNNYESDDCIYQVYPSVYLHTCSTYLPTYLSVFPFICLPVFFVLCVFLKATDVPLALQATLIH